VFKHWIIAAFALNFCTQAVAQQPTGSAYCSAGSAAFFLLTGKDQDKGLATLRSKCKPGDIIDIPENLTYSIAAACDFSKAIVATHGSVTCVFQGVRPERR
jgi:hypothetical protein